VAFLVEKVALGQVFSEYFGFPHQLLHMHLSSGAGTIYQLVADVPNGLSVTLSHEIKKKIIASLEFEKSGSLDGWSGADLTFRGG
jgi:hypothetical protein